MIPGLMTPLMMGGYNASAVTFDGTNDYLTRGAGLTGAADSKLVTGSFWIRKQGSDSSTERILASFDGAGGGSATFSFRMNKGANDNIAIVGENSGGTIILNVASSVDSVEVADGWRNVLFSFDMANTSNRHLYIHDVSDLATVTTYTDDSIDFTNGDWAFAADADGGNKIQADFADPLFWPGTYLNLSIESNRRLFIDTTGKPVNPAIAIATLGTPLIRFAGPASGFHTNLGSGGGFTLNGTLTDAATSPSG